MVEKLRELLSPKSLLISNEVMPQRANILTENMTKWGNANTIVTNNNPSDFQGLGAFFDVIVADVPCSGEGMFRKDEGAVRDWSLKNVEMCAARQREIIEDIWPALKPGGYLIYSTCTFNRMEDEDNVRWMMDKFGADAIDLNVDPKWNVAGSLTQDNLPVYHFMQHRTRGEGFFICLLRKPEGANACLKSRPFRSEGSKVPVECKSWLKPDGGYEFFIKNESVYALPSDLKDDMWQAGQDLYALVPGIEVAVMKGRDWVPAHGLAMSTALNRDAFNCVEVNRQQALAYLHCDAIRLEDAQRGIVLLTYKGIPLGFAKNIGNRANNLYPQEWRIRSSVS